MCYTVWGCYHIVLVESNSGTSRWHALNTLNKNVIQAHGLLRPCSMKNWSIILALENIWAVHLHKTTCGPGPVNQKYNKNSSHALSFIQYLQSSEAIRQICVRNRVKVIIQLTSWLENLAWQLWSPFISMCIADWTFCYK